MDERGIMEHNIQYVAYGLETCPNTKKEHHQGWLYSNTDSKRSFSAWKKLFKKLELEKMHFEQIKGSFSDNTEYVSKEGQLTEIGEKPMQNGKKRKILDFKHQIEEGKQVLDIASADEHFGTFLQYRSGLMAYAQHQRWKSIRLNRDVPEVYIRIGPPGTGKTRWLDERFKSTQNPAHTIQNKAFKNHLTNIATM